MEWTAAIKYTSRNLVKWRDLCCCNIYYICSNTVEMVLKVVLQGGIKSGPKK